MLVNASNLSGTPILSMQDASLVARISEAIVDPNTLKIIAFRVSDSPNGPTADLLATSSIREYSNYGMVIDSTDEFINNEDVVKISEILSLNFNLIGLKVESKKHAKIGKVVDYTLTSDNFEVQQIIVHRPLIKSFVDPTLTIHRREIVEITDYKVIVKDDAKTIKARSEAEDFIPNFVNPFRNSEPNLAPADTKTPADKDKK